MFTATVVLNVYRNNKK